MTQLEVLLNPSRKGARSYWGHSGDMAEPCASPDSARAAVAATTRLDWQWRCTIAGLVILDALVTWISLSLAYGVRISSGLLEYRAAYDPQDYQVLALLAIPIYLISAALSGLYKRDNLFGGLVEYQQVLKACTTSVIGLVMVSFLWRDFEMLSRGWLVLSWSFSVVLFIGGRFLARRAASRLRRHGWLTARVLIVGANDQGVAMATQWLSPGSGMHVVGFLDDFKPIGTPVVDGLKVLGRPTALNELVQATGAREVVMVPTAVAWETLERMITAVKPTDPYVLRVSPGFYETLATGIAVTTKTFVPLFTLNETRLVGIDALVKLAFDYLLGTALVLLCMPVMAAVALALKLSAPGTAILERYETVGQFGQVFNMVKFRHDRCQEESGDRSLCSRLGRWLYRTGLDKAPQLVNVLRGEMSLVGPRPRAVDDCAADERAADNRFVRTSERAAASSTHRSAEHNVRTVKPGLTGPWTVSAYWKNSDETQSDLYYVRNWTVWLDAQILFQSVRSWCLSLISATSRT